MLKTSFCVLMLCSFTAALNCYSCSSVTAKCPTLFDDKHNIAMFEKRCPLPKGLMKCVVIVTHRERKMFTTRGCVPIFYSCHQLMKAIGYLTSASSTECRSCRTDLCNSSPGLTRISPVAMVAALLHSYLQTIPKSVYKFLISQCILPH